MNLEYFQSNIVGSQFVDQLKSDIEKSESIRFCVAYISEAGWNGICDHNFIRLLDSKYSFGVTSLWCHAFKGALESMIAVNEGLNDHEKLKAFIGPHVPSDGEPVISLLHSKTICLMTKTGLETFKAIIYIGSHNWTNNALNLSSPVNSENSIRMEFNDITLDEINGKGDSIVAQVNKYLIGVHSLSSSFALTNANQGLFDQWRMVFCAKTFSDSQIEKGDAIVLIAVGEAEFDYNTIVHESIYLLTRDNEEGTLVFTNNQKSVILLIWNSIESLKNKGIPQIHFGKLETIKAPGGNRSKSTVSNFKWWLDEYDRVNETEDNSVIPDTWKLCYNSSERTSSSINPENDKYHEFQLKLIPKKDGKTRGELFPNEDYYQPGDLVLASLEKKGGHKFTIENAKYIYIRNKQVEQTIISEFIEIFRLHDDDLKISNKPPSITQGFRTTTHPINRLLIGRQELNEEFYTGIKKRRIKTVYKEPDGVVNIKSIKRTSIMTYAILKDLLKIWHS